MSGFYYLHENGDLIWKKFRPEEEPGGFVRKVWPVDESDRKTAWTIILEAMVFEANHQRVRELADKWGCDARDAVELMLQVKPSEMQRVGLKLFLTEIVGVDYDAWMNWLGSTPEGAEPNFATMPTGK